MQFRSGIIQYKFFHTHVTFFVNNPVLFMKIHLLCVQACIEFAFCNSFFSSIWVKAILSPFRDNMDGVNLSRLPSTESHSQTAHLRSLSHWNEIEGSSITGESDWFLKTKQKDKKPDWLLKADTMLFSFNQETLFGLVSMVTWHIFFWSLIFLSFLFLFASAHRMNITVGSTPNRGSLEISRQELEWESRTELRCLIFAQKARMRTRMHMQKLPWGMQ